MTKIRVALLGVAFGIAIPAALLVYQALGALRAEYRSRHEIVSERAFDEMERVLSGFLAAEEARAFEEYRFSSQESWNPERDRPIVAAPEHSFVLGYFQLDPDGQLHAPFARDVLGKKGDAAKETNAQELGVIEQGLRNVQSLLGGLGSRSTQGVMAEVSPATLDLESGEAAEEKLAASAERQDSDERGVYQVLGRLNRAAEQRSARKQKIESAPRARLAQAPTASSSALPSIADSAERPSQASPRPGAEADLRVAATRAASESIERRVARLAGDATDSASGMSAPSARVEGAATAKSSDTPEPSDPARNPLGSDDGATVEVLVDPMRGLPLAPDATELVLYRTITADDQRTLQGLVLDQMALGRWLESEVLGEAELAAIASARFTRGAPARTGDSNELRFRHRFADPFADLGIELELQPLEGWRGASVLLGVCALLALVAGIGLVAIDRMVFVAMDFSERRSNFVAAVSHELKTPLTAIRMYAEMLRDGLVPSDAKRQEYYGTITDESERLSRLINNVLEFSRLEKGNRELSLSVGDLRPVIEEAADRLRPHIEREGFALTLDLAAELPASRFDRDALLQMLFNLIDNAMKYAGQEVRREIVVSAQPYDGGVQVSVRDFGPGVPRGQLDRIFEPFYRAQDERTRSAQGTGIGLALVQELAEAMGAKVKGENAEGGGLRVALSLAGAT